MATFLHRAAAWICMNIASRTIKAQYLWHSGCLFSYLRVLYISVYFLFSCFVSVCTILLINYYLFNWYSETFVHFAPWFKRPVVGLLFLNLKDFLFLPMLRSLVRSCIRFLQCSLTRPPFQRGLGWYQWGHCILLPALMRPGFLRSRGSQLRQTLAHVTEYTERQWRARCSRIEPAQNRQTYILVVLKQTEQGWNTCIKAPPCQRNLCTQAERSVRCCFFFFCSVQQVLWRLHIHMTCFVNLEGALTSPYTQLGAGG